MVKPADELHQRILKYLREITATKSPLTQQLNDIVVMLARRLKVGVCSCYLTRPGDILELCATYGLDATSVHETFLRIGEGLIGEIAVQKKPLNFADAWAHPSFVHKPATKEKRFKSLMGVPIMRRNYVLGVLAVQTDKVQEFSAEEIHILEHVAMVLAEMLGRQAKAQRKKLPSLRHRRLDGVMLVEGLAIGQAVVHKRSENFLGILTKNTQSELKRLAQAFDAMEKQINAMLIHPDIKPADTEIIEAYLKFTQDKGWREKIKAFIEKGFTAEVAVNHVLEDMTNQMSAMADSYIRERIHDLQDLSHRLVRHLGGLASKNKEAFPKDAILVAESLGPAELLDYDVEKIKALVLQNGSQTMHVVIIARSLNIPVISVYKDIQTIDSGDILVLDGTGKTVYINPSEDVLDIFTTHAREIKRLQERFESQKDLAALTKEGIRISLKVNFGLPTDSISLAGENFDGIGLYRTELPFLTADTLPDCSEQTKIYTQVVKKFPDKPICFRTLDIGSDKVLPYFDNHGEQNPALGWRSIRITLDRRSLLREQLRAFIRATAGRPLHVMFPMISDMDELVAAKQTLMIELERAKAKKQQLPTKVFVGTMVEVPSLIYQLPSILPLVDFVSIGTNDLMQFLFAVDRGNPEIWEKYDCLSPIFLTVLKQINEACEKAHKPCCVCGEMAGKPLEAMALVGLGFRALSMAPSCLGAVKAVIRTMNQERTADYLARQLNASDHSLRDKLKSYALDSGVFI